MDRLFLDANVLFSAAHKAVTLWKRPETTSPTKLRECD